MGYSACQANLPLRREPIPMRLILILYTLAASLRSTMTKLFTVGVSLVAALKLQILSMFLDAGGTGFGTMAAVSWAKRRLLVRRDRLRLDRIERKCL